MASTALRMACANDGQTFCQAFEAFMAGTDPARSLFTLVKLMDVIFDGRYVHLVHAYAEKSDQHSFRVRPPASI